MKNLTHENHFQFGYNGEYFNQRKSPSDTWNVKYGRCKRKPDNFRAECVNAAKLIKESTTKDIYVLLSGGVDSEIVARSFIEADIPITCLIARFNDDMNEHDISYAFDFCDEYNVKYIIIDINIYDFWKKDLYKYASMSKCISPQLILPMWLSDQVDGYTIIGAGECYMVQNFYHEFELWEKEKIASWYRHYMINDKEGCPGFFQYTPELMLSFISDDIINNIEDRVEGYSTYFEKNEVYHHHWSTLKKRLIFTGFEKFKNLDYNICRPYLENKFGEYNGVHKTNVDDLKDILSPIECNKCSQDLIMQYHNLYEVEGMTLKRNPYSIILKYTYYYVAIINNQIAGFTCMDFLSDDTVYVHGAYTFPKFRGQGINRSLWNFKMKDLESTPNMLIRAINPDWLPDASFQKEMLERKGFVHTSNRPDGAPVLTVKYKELKE